MPLKGFRKSHCLRGHQLSAENTLEYTKDGYAVRHCKECLKIRSKNYILARGDRNKEYHRNQHRKRTFKLSPQLFEEKMKEQGRACAVCCEEFVASPNIDHDRSCCSGKKSCGNCVRGLLCWRCNTVLGKMLDSPALLRKAADYIEKWGEVYVSRTASNVVGEAQTG